MSTKIMTLLGMLLFLACSANPSSVPQPKAHYHCSEMYVCPSGSECIEDCCDGPPCDVNNNYMERSEDLGADDLRPSKYAAGCASTIGFQYSPAAALCPGVFSGNPGSLCAAGWSVCTANPMTMAECRAMRPFGVQGCYLGAARGTDTEFPATANMHCAWAGAGSADNRYIMACGSCVGWSEAGVECGGFANVVTCDDARSIFAYHCPKSVPGVESDFLQVTNGDPASGVVCCKG